MKSNFKYIVIGIISILSLVFLFQLYWLGGLYRTIEQEANNTIQKCISDANMDELQFRMDSLENRPDKSEKTITITWEDDDNENNEGGTKRSKKVMHKQDTLYSAEHEDPNDARLKDMNEILISFREIIHQSIDTIMPIQLDTLRSMIDNNIRDTYITTKVYGVDILEVETGKVLDSNMDSIYLAKTDTQIFTYDSENNLAYRVYIEPLTKNILYQMAGILSTTALIIIILGFAFWYLIKTIMNLRTLEEMKDDFTNNMTHELKTPIAVAYSATDALLNFGHGDNKERRDKYLTICKDQLSELSERVEQILSMSMERRQTFILNKEEISISAMANNLISQYKLKYEGDKAVTFRLDISPDDMIVVADRIHLNNIISNLIDNAIKYSETDVTVDIKIYRDEKSDIFEIKDNGIGIPAEKLPYIFDKFYRVTYGNKYTSKGYGLGLFYIKTMVEKHGGNVSVESQVDKGSKFTIIIPR